MHARGRRGRGGGGGGNGGGRGGGANFRGRGGRGGRGGANWSRGNNVTTDQSKNTNQRDYNSGEGSSSGPLGTNNGADQRGPWGRSGTVDQRSPWGGADQRGPWGNAGQRGPWGTAGGTSDQSGPQGGSDQRGPQGGTDQRGPRGGAGQRGPWGTTGGTSHQRGPWGSAGGTSDQRGPQGGTDQRGPRGGAGQRGPWGSAGGTSDQRGPRGGSDQSSHWGRGGGGNGDDGAGSGDEPKVPQNVSSLGRKSGESSNINSSPPVTEFRSLGISQSLQKSPQPGDSRRIPIERPDKGGKSAAQHVRILVNHFHVKFNPYLTIYHYDVDIKPEKSESKEANVAISKSVLRKIKNKFSAFDISNTAYDGEKSIFSAVELPAGIFKVEVPMREGLRTYTFTIKLANELKLNNLEEYLTGRIRSIPREILQGMDLVMKEQPVNKLLTIGRNFFLGNGYNDDLQDGLIASKGFQHTLKPTSQGVALCVDYSVLTFLKPDTVLGFLSSKLKMTFNQGKTLNQYEKEAVIKALRGLKLMVTHRISKQKFMVTGLTEATSNEIKFTLEHSEGKREIQLVDYFRKKYGLEIRYKHLPCLDISKSIHKKNFVPMECCVLAEGQIFPKDGLTSDAAKKFREICLAKPLQRMEIIQKMVRESDGPCGGKVAGAFEIEVDTSMTEVTGHLIQPPDLKLGDEHGRAKKFTPRVEKCQWNLTNQSLLEGKEIRCWGIVDFSSSNKKLDRNRFVQQLINRCHRLRIKMGQESFYIQSNMNTLSDPNGLRNLLKSIKTKTNANGRLDIMIFVMRSKDPGYKNLKKISETELGILTQCCLVEPANYANDQYLGNLALKINAKLGGSNVELINRLPGLEGNGPVMFVGADVNHPGAHNLSSPSIVAVVATINWPAANKYVARIRPQQHRQEKIENFGEICLDLINTFTRLNKAKPERIIVFRDGVSDNQFDMVLNEELNDLQSVINSSRYHPKITVVVAQKRHQTRLFLKDNNKKQETTTSGNVFPGTVIDTTIVHPREFDFYLCSHYGSIGTSKATHYYVLYDDHGFTSDELQKLIYYLCYTFARCTKPISLVPPVYYADLAAYRGRLYHEASMESTTASSSSSSSPSADQEMFKLHGDLENAMFFC